MESATLECLNFNQNRHLLFKWLESESVKKWWGDPESRLQQAEKTPSDQQALNSVSGTPVGYICWQRISQEKLNVVRPYNVLENLIDIDLFIGNPDFRGKGFAP